jgi:Co/Zn/Cd efflux system component
MIPFLIWVVILLIGLYIVKLILEALFVWFRTPQPVQNIVMLVVGLVALIYVLDHIGMIWTPYTADYGYRAYR